MAIGTPYYISPEQVRGEINIDIRADIYSLGATLYHMVTGKVPYGGDTPNDVMRKHVDLKVYDRPARPLEPKPLRRAGDGRRDHDGQEPRAPLSNARRPDPRPQVPAARRKPDDRRPEARNARSPWPRASRTPTSKRRRVRGSSSSSWRRTSTTAITSSPPSPCCWPSRSSPTSSSSSPARASPYPGLTRLSYGDLCAAPTELPSKLAQTIDVLGRISAPDNCRTYAGFDGFESAGTSSRPPRILVVREGDPGIRTRCTRRRRSKRAAEPHSVLAEIE